MYMGSLMTEVLRGASPELVTDVFIGLILAMLAFATFQASRGRHSRFLEHAPNLMTSVGIIGTFTGIVIGLIAFNVDKIDASIPALLEGLKTAFMTSLVGMLAAVSFKGLDSFWFAQKREEDEAPSSVTPSHVLGAIESGNKHLISVRDALSQDNDSSLTGVLQRMRGEMRDRADDEKKTREVFQGQLFEEMRNFAELLSKSATETVIEALKEVIVDFNKNLTEQFGENFKRLDDSVQKLVIWQEQYMQQLEQMSVQYSEGVKAIDATKVAVEDISEKSASIPESMQRMQTVLEVNQHQIQELQRHLEAFVSMRDKAIEAIPMIDKHMNDVGENLSTAANDMKMVLLEGATDFKDSVQQTHTAMQSLANEVQGSSDQVAETLKDAAEALESTTRQAMVGVESSVASTAESIRGTLEKTAEQLNTEINKSVNRSLNTSEQQIEDATKRTNEAINKQLAALDEALEKELNGVLHEMGQSLAKVTGQFAKDYTGLVNAMNDVVNRRAA
jgi:F0F1-type ATP synthase membrane subunit b/b'